MKRARTGKVQQPGGRWSGWVAASGLLHALLLGGLVLVLGSATGPPVNLRVRLVTEIKAVSESPVVRQAPSMPPAISKKVSTPGKAPVETSPAEPSRSPDVVPEMARLPTAPLSPSLAPTGSGGSRAPAGPIGEGAARSLLPRSGPQQTHADPPPPPAGAAPAPAPPQPEAAAGGFFLVPGSGGSGTGRIDYGAADQGAGPGGGGSGGSGSGRGGPGGPGKSRSGGGGSGFASRGGVGGGGDGSGFADLLRSIRHRIEQAKTYPDAARREGIQGTVDLRFRIAADGSVEAMEILRSSGHRILDEASEQTIRRAAPYPRVPGWIRLPIAYRLDQ